MKIDPKTPPLSVDFQSLRYTDQIYWLYTRVTSFVARFFQWINLDSFGDPIVSIFSEPMATMEVAKGVSDKEPQVHHLNQTAMNADCCSKIALLMIHGGGNHLAGTWIPFAKALEDRDVKIPLFTVDMTLPGHWLQYEHEIQKEEVEAVEQKIKTIEERWPTKSVCFWLIGHSRGADTALQVEQKHPDKIAKVIRIGNPIKEERQLPEESQQKVIDIVGLFDAITPGKSSLPKEQQFTALEGHLGLLLSPAVHDFVIQHLDP